MAMLWVNGVEIVPDPSSMTWGLQDISAADAGRVHDAGNTMYKMRTSQKRKIQLTWTLLTATQVAGILNAFNSEYFDVTYWDAMGDSLQTRTFYAGDRTAPVKWFGLASKGTRFATLSFDIIER